MCLCACVYTYICTYIYICIYTVDDFHLGVGEDVLEGVEGALLVVLKQRAVHGAPDGVVDGHGDVVVLDQAALQQPPRVLAEAHRRAALAGVLEGASQQDAPRLVVADDARVGLFEIDAG